MRMAYSGAYDSLHPPSSSQPLLKNMDMNPEHTTTGTQPTGLIIVRRRRLGLRSLRRLVASIADFSKRLIRRAPGAGGPNDGALTTTREWLQSAGVAINVLFSIAEAIPVVGPSIKGALEALYKVLQLIEVSDAF